MESDTKDNSDNQSAFDKNYHLSDRQHQILLNFYQTIKPLMDKTDKEFILRIAIRTSLIDFVSNHLSHGFYILDNRWLAVETMIACHENQTKLTSEHFNEVQLFILQGIYDYMVYVFQQHDGYEINQESSGKMISFLVANVTTFYLKEYLGILKNSKSVRFVIDYHKQGGSH